MRLLEILFRRQPDAERAPLGLALDSPAALRAGCWLHARVNVPNSSDAGSGRPMGVHPFHGGVAAATPRPATATSVASLLTRHFLRDGEIILLIIKPSFWYVTLSSIRFAAAVLIGIIASHLWFHQQIHLMLEAGVFVLAGRMMWSVLGWMGRLYVLTDQRVVRISGVFTADIFECPLRRVARTRVIANFGDRLLGVGSIEIIPQEEDRPCGSWNTVRAPVAVNQQIVTAIKRARSGLGCQGIL